LKAFEVNSPLLSLQKTLTFLFELFSTITWNSLKIPKKKNLQKMRPNHLGAIISEGCT
jgi:hypothetical protein